MNAQQSKALLLVANALTELAQGGSTPGADATNHILSSSLDKSPAPTLAQTEVERELARISRAGEKVSAATERLWKRLNAVTYPPAPGGEGCNSTIEACGSQLGNGLQAEALRLESTASSLNYLADSLAV